MKSGLAGSVAVFIWSCGGCGAHQVPPIPSVLTFDGGSVSNSEVDRELGRLPPPLRDRFDSENGRKDLAESIADRKVLALEARRLGLDKEPEIVAQVQALEERLIIKALLARPENKPPVTEEPARAYFNAHQEDFRDPTATVVIRVLAAADRKDKKAWEAARKRAQGWAARLEKSNAAAIAKEGDGPEHTTGGLIAPIHQGDAIEPALMAAALALRLPGDVSRLVETKDGIAVLKMLERRPSRIPPFEEIRAKVESVSQPVRQRQAFDNLLVRLRREYGIRSDGAAAPKGG